MSDVEQLIGWWRELHENWLWFVSLNKYFSDNPIKKYDLSVSRAWHRTEKYRLVSGIVERHLNVPIGRVAERELWSGGLIYIQGEWLRGNCRAAVG